LYEKLLDTKIFSSVYDAPFFKEFVLKCHCETPKLNEYLLEKGILSGLDLETVSDQQQHQILFCASELRTKEQMDDLVKKIEEFFYV
jgi:glycine dehydrogenase subunit 1